MRRLTPSRRETLVGAAATVAACTAPSDDTGEPAPEAATIDTIVVLMMENRSFDHYLGALRLVEGRTEVDGLDATMSNPDSNGDEIPVSLFADFLKTLVLTLANPSTILTFMAIFAGVPAAGAGELQAVPMIVLGVLLGSAAWWLTLSQGVGVIRHRISEQALKWMNWAAGILLVAFGVYTLGHLALHWPD